MDGRYVHYYDHVLQATMAIKASHHRPFIRQTGPMTRLLRSKKTLSIVSPAGDIHSLSVARRIAHALLLYFRVCDLIIQLPCIRILISLPID